MAMRALDARLPSGGGTPAAAPCRRAACARPAAPAASRRQQRSRAPLRRWLVCASETDGGGASRSGESSEAAFAAVQACMDLLQRPDRDLDALVAFLPDTVIDRLIERKRAKR